MKEHYFKKWLFGRSRRQRDPDQGLGWGWGTKGEMDQSFPSRPLYLNWREVRLERNWGIVKNQMNDANLELQEDVNSRHKIEKLPGGGSTQAWKGRFDEGRGGKGNFIRQAVKVQQADGS